MFIITERKCLNDKESLSLYGLRRERGKTKFSPEKMFQAYGPKAMSGSVTFAYEEEIEKTRRPGICVIRVGGIGDLIMLSASLNKLKQKNPKSPLVLATHPQNQRIFRNLKCLDDCISVFDVHRYDFDRTIDLRWMVEPDKLAPGKGKLPWKDYTSKDRSDCFDSICGVNSKKKPFEVPLNGNQVTEMKKIVGQNDKPVIGFTPTCRAMHRSYPHDYVKPLVKMLTKQGKVILFGKTEEWDEYLGDLEIPGMVNILDKTSGNQALALCSLLDILITPDSGFLHAAGSLGIKCVGLFGNIAPKTRISYYPSVKGLYARDYKILGCSPCWDLHEECTTFKDTAPCMRLHTPSRVMEKVERSLDA